MRPFNEIKQLFENKSYLIRSDFINDYDFKDNYFEYYKQFILKSDNIKNHLYLSDLIDLSGWLGIYDKKLQDRWLSYLLMPKHYVVKLAVLDYFKFCNKKLLDDEYEKNLKQFLNRKLAPIVRAQVLFNLIALKSKDNNAYIQKLYIILFDAKDWKIVHRVANNLREIKIDSKSRLAICNHLNTLATKMDLGKDTLNLLVHINDTKDLV